MARSKEFDESAVLDKAMRIFWEQGYEKTSMRDLVEHMGVHRRSLYDTFTDKHTLFLKALDRFGERINARLEAGIQQSQTALEALQFIFNFMIHGDNDVPPGCMFVNSAIELAIRDAVVDEKAIGAFKRTEQLLVDIVERGQRNSEFTTQFDSRELVEYLHNSLMGIRVMVRTSFQKEKLQRIAELTMHILKK